MYHAPRFATAAVAVFAALVVSAASITSAAPANAQPSPPSSTTMTCGSANPLLWAPPFTWNIRASSGASRPPGGVLEPAILLGGGTELPGLPASLFPIFGINWYGTRVLVDWHNQTTGTTGHSVSDEAVLRPSPDIPINRTWTGVGTVSFTVTVQTGAGWWFINTQTAVCRGTISVHPV
ncbi:hypothetical protein B0T44_14390 [Nocardia donostiensis]|uniref:Uncharacterized protein n=1 Tax=Nocardia donostiensis TaxID=1538463 RepID=A0A1W0BA28_9NOCA|nr:hypothetical protein B0T46_02655 [Nocardia donostiensis]OQS19389.1 hypothetical protein B0T44_14390 [Nocardia donostiensis]